MGAHFEKYLSYCGKLKRMLYNELICSNFSQDEYIEYDPHDELANEIFEPMFNSIIGFTLDETKQALKEHIASSLDYYGIGSYDSIDKVIPKLIASRSILRQVFQAAKAEQAAENSGLNQRQKELSNELDEYLRIGEELSRAENSEEN